MKDEDCQTRRFETGLDAGLVMLKNVTSIEDAIASWSQCAVQFELSKSLIVHFRIVFSTDLGICEDVLIVLTANHRNKVGKGKQF